MRDRRNHPGTSPRVALLGAPDDTGNLGVTALQHATVAALVRRLPEIELTVFDNGLCERWKASVTAAGGPASYRRLGLRSSRRVHLPESLANVRVSARLPWLLSNGVADALLGADAILDISGGDSFSDLYGRRRLRSIAEPKRFVLRHGRPLILLPQTYGPFRSGRAARDAGSVVSRARLAFARDVDSHEVMRSLLGERFDPRRHRLGVDVAFSLQPTPPQRPLPDALADWLRDRTRPCVGVNISGLLANDPGSAAQYGLADPYRRTMEALVRRLVADTTARVVLVPHVNSKGVESDERAAAALRATLSAEVAERVALAPTYATPGEAKWLISQLDWLCGTRMHATIAALSAGVPVAAVAYSPKVRGVFAACGVETEVVDARRLDGREMLEQLLASFERRAAIGETLRRHVPRVVDASEAQMDAIAMEISDLVDGNQDTTSPSRQRGG